MDWKRFIRFNEVPSSQASLALAVIALGHAWSLYVPKIGPFTRQYCAIFGALLLIPVLIKYFTNFSLFIRDLQNPLTGSLMAPITMALLVLCDYLAAISPLIAYPIWFSALLLHLVMMILFFFFQIVNFKMAHLLPSWFLYPVGMISSSLAGTQFGHTVFSSTLVNICVAIYFFMLPVVLYRLVFEGMVPKRARPTLAIMAAPINLTLAAYLVNYKHADPILTGALAGIAITMTVLVYLCYLKLLKSKFQPSIATVTFPSVISAVAMHHLTTFFAAYYPHWHWLHHFGWFELSVATGLVIWVTFGYIKMYWPEIINKQKDIKNNVP